MLVYRKMMKKDIYLLGVSGGFLVVPKLSCHILGRWNRILLKSDLLQLRGGQVNLIQIIHIEYTYICPH